MKKFSKQEDVKSLQRSGTFCDLSDRGKVLFTAFVRSLDENGERTFEEPLLANSTKYGHNEYDPNEYSLNGDGPNSNGPNGYGPDVSEKAEGFELVGSNEVIKNNEKEKLKVSFKSSVIEMELNGFSKEDLIALISEC